MQLNPDVHILGGQAEIIDTDGNYLMHFPPQPLTSKGIYKVLKFAPGILHPTYFVRKSAYNHLCGYKDLITCEDYDFLLRAANNKMIMNNLNEVILKYRKNPAGMTLSNLHRTYYISHQLKKHHSKRFNKYFFQKSHQGYPKEYKKESYN